jgi:hypothetical protein
MEVSETFNFAIFLLSLWLTQLRAQLHDGLWGFDSR